MKSKFFSYGLLSICAVTMLGACNGVVSDAGEQIDQHISDPKPYVENNLYSPDENMHPKKVYKEVYSERNVNLNDISLNVADSSNQHSGILVTTTNDQNKYVGFYSTDQHKLIYQSKYTLSEIDYNVTSNPVGTFIMVRHNSNFMFFDNMGNVLHIKTGSGYSIRWGIEWTMRDETPYITLKAGNDTMYFKYNRGHAIEVNSIPEEKEETEDVHLHLGDLFRSGNTVPLDKFGKSGYYLSVDRNYVVTLFDSTDRAQNSFTLPLNVPLILFGESIYYQESNKLPEDNEKYAYYADGAKYTLQTYCLNLFSGKTTKMNFNYKIGNALPLKDGNGNYSYFYASIARINEYKVLDSFKDVVLDKDFHILGNFTGLGLTSFIKLSNGNYYNISSKILYDNDLKPITDLSTLTPTYYEKGKVFIGSYGGKYGAIGEDGRVKINFNYDRIIAASELKYAILAQNRDSYNDYNQNRSGYYELYNFETNRVDKTYYDMELRTVNAEQGVYMMVNQNNFEVISLKKGAFYNLRNSVNVTFDEVEVNSDAVRNINRLNDTPKSIINYTIIMRNVNSNHNDKRITLDKIFSFGDHPYNINQITSSDVSYF